LTRPSIIAIDGTAASGKSTIGALLARHLGYLYFDTGVMYRAVTLAALQRGIPISNENAVTALAKTITIDVTPPTEADGRQYTVYIDGQDVTWAIRSPEVEAGVSPVSAYPGVREALTAQQRRIGLQRRVVMAGRDIGTVVLPEADLKLFMDASIEERARRRQKELRGRGQDLPYEEVLASVRQRDKIDSERACAPLRPAPDAIYINTDGLTIEEVFSKVKDLLCQDCGERGMTRAEARIHGTGGIVAHVAPGSLAEAIGLRPGDSLVAVNGHRLCDVIDFRFYSAEEEVEIEVDRDGRRLTLQVQQSYGLSLNVEFVHPTFDVDIRRCLNRCEFCFVTQSPPGMRPTLYVKDDDYRYSFLYGNFITLTNLAKEDWERIAEQHLSPLYISVHATEPELRRRILGQGTGEACLAPTDIMGQLRRLTDMGIDLHTQLVLIPGVNDGPHLDRSLEDLSALFPAVRTVALVPVGLTRYHTGPCRPYSSEEARVVLRQVKPWRRDCRRRFGRTFVYPADEWYLMSGTPLPSAASYDSFEQLDNGVGLTRRFLDQWTRLKKRLPCQRRMAWQRTVWVCGTLFGPTLQRIASEVAALSGSEIEVVPVVNAFYGETVTVSGLLVGQDVLNALHGRDLGDGVLLPRAMFDSASGATLDDLSLADISSALNVPVGVAESPREAIEAMKQGWTRPKVFCPSLKLQV
jgi:cytidylate kinase